MSGVVEFGDPGCDCSQAHAGLRGGGAGGGERSQDEGGCAVAQETRILDSCGPHAENVGL